MLHLSGFDGKILEMTFFDITGKQLSNVVSNELAGSPINEVSVRDLKPGIYLYSVRTEGLLYTGKFLVQR